MQVSGSLGSSRVCHTVPPDESTVQRDQFTLETILDHIIARSPSNQGLPSEPNLDLNSAKARALVEKWDEVFGWRQYRARAPLRVLLAQWRRQREYVRSVLDKKDKGSVEKSGGEKELVLLGAEETRLSGLITQGEGIEASMDKQDMPWIAYRLRLKGYQNIPFTKYEGSRGGGYCFDPPPPRDGNHLHTRPRPTTVAKCFEQNVSTRR